MAKPKKLIGRKRRINPNSLKNLRRGGPGRPKGSKNHDGLQVVIDMLKDLISEKKNVAILRAAMQREMINNPLGFYYKYIMPLVPRNLDLTSGGKDLILQISEQYAPKINRESNGAK